MIDELENLEISEYDLVAEICRESFYEFVKEFWDIIIQEKPVWNWHIMYICNELQTIAERVFNNQPKLYDLIINVPPGSTKSTICTVMFPAWIWTRLRSARIISGSYAAPLALNLSRKGRDIVRSAKYRTCFPDVVIKDDQDTKSFYSTIHGGERHAVGVGGSVTGTHAHFIIVDDPLNPLKAASEVELQNANVWMDETLSTRKVDKEITPTILIMQRLHQNDCTQNMINQARRIQEIEGGPLPLKHICLPAELNDDVQPVLLKKYYKDRLLDPVRISRKVLERQRIQLGEYGYASQMLQKPVPRGGGMFKVNRIKYSDDYPSHLISVCRFWDKAGTAGGKGAYTVGAKLGITRENRIWFLDVIRGRWDSAERERIIKETAIKDGKNVIVGIEQEPGSGGKESAENTVRNLLGFIVKVDKPSGSDSSKENRADPLSVQMNNGNIYIQTGKQWLDDLLNEFEYFPFSTYKDQVDAFSGAFNTLNKNKKQVGGMNLFKKGIK